MARNNSFQKVWGSAPVQLQAPPDVRIANGWIGGAQGDLPRAEWENWWHNRVDEALRELEMRSAMTWFADVVYSNGAVAWHNGAAWISLVDNNTAPPTEGEFWTRRALAGGGGGAMPAGAVVPFAGAGIPDGWLMCDGALVSKTLYSDLFAAIGTVYGQSGDNFRIPDLRDRFIRGTNGGGRALGRTESDALQNITGQFMSRRTPSGQGGAVTAGSGAFSVSTGGDGSSFLLAPAGSSGLIDTATFDASRVVRTATETRPRNMALHYIIKY